MRNFKIRDKRFYDDWLKPVLSRKKIDHVFLQNGDDCFVKTDLSGTKFHRLVMRAQCEKEEKENWNGTGIHVVTYEEMHYRYMPYPYKKQMKEKGHFAYVLCEKDAERYGGME